MCHGGVELVRFFEAEFFGQSLHIGLGLDFEQGFFQLQPALFAHTFGVLAADVGADFGGGLVAFHPAFIQPVYGGLALFGGDDFHALAVLQRSGERHDLAVYLRTATAVAQAAVQGVGEVDGSGAHG